MPDWLTGVREVLAVAATPVHIFFRDDDAGWTNDKLYLLLDEFAQFGMAIDVAIIPQGLGHGLADKLLSRWQQDKAIIGLHQHGYNHTNHELAGRKCEFGSSRSKDQQKVDIARGQEHLLAMLGNAVDPIFTPPWNRCTQDTVACLEELGFRLLSRDVTAASLHSSVLQQIPVHIDWSQMMRISSNPLPALGQAIADALEKNAVTGIMLHHAELDGGHLKTLAELLAVFEDHENVQGLLLRECAGCLMPLK